MILKLKHHFDAAHRLEFHKGLCQNIHGHRWEVEIEINSCFTGDMIVDFGDIKELIDEFDHSLILKKCEGNKELIHLAKKKKWRLILLENSPTAENLSLIIQRKILRFIDSHLYILPSVQVKIWESPNALIEVI